MVERNELPGQVDQAQRLVGLDNSLVDWQASVRMWLEEGEELVRRLYREAIAHQQLAGELAVEGRRVAKVLGEMGLDIDGRAFAGFGAQNPSRWTRSRPRASRGRLAAGPRGDPSP